MLVDNTNRSKNSIRIKKKEKTATMARSVLQLQILEKIKAKKGGINFQRRGELNGGGGLNFRRPQKEK